MYIMFSIFISDTGSTFCQAHGYLPIFRQSIAAVGWYQFILLGEQRYKCVNDLLRVAG